MVVLGKTNDEKGAHLEVLTANLLRRLGYTDVATNVVNAGGSEVDVRGTYLVPMPGSPGSRLDVLGECKALRRKVDMDEWSKLLGKLFVERAKQPQTVGIFVALNGFNGNVIGAFNELNRVQPNVMHLFDRDGIERIAIEGHGAAPREAIETSVKRYTKNRIVQISLAYYGEDVLWLVEFTDGRFAALDKLGVPIQVQNDADLIERIDVFSEGAELIDLEAEWLALAEQEKAARSQIARLFEAGGTLLGTELHLDPTYSSSEHRRATERLIGAGLIVSSQASLSLTFPQTDHSEELFLKTVGFFVSGEVTQSDFSKLFYSNLFIVTVDTNLAAHACKVQRDIPMPTDRLDNVVHWMRLSPSALIIALTPQQLIVEHRKIDEVPDPLIDEHDTEYFLSMLMTAFLDDLRNPFLSRFYFDKEIYEVDQWTRILVKGPGGAYDARNFQRSTALERRFGGMTAIRRRSDLFGPEWDWLSEM